MRWGLLAALLLATGFAAAASTDGSPLAKADAAMAQARENDMPLLAPEAWDKATEAYARCQRRRRSQPLASADRQVRRRGDDGDQRRSRHRPHRPHHVRSDADEPQQRALGRRRSARDAHLHQGRRTVSQSRDHARERHAGQGAVAGRQRRCRAIAPPNSKRSKARSCAMRAICSTQADEENVEKYAPQTLGQARASLAEAEKAIVEDRYDTDRARLLAKQAKEQASHALHLAAQIKGVQRRRPHLRGSVVALGSAGRRHRQRTQRDAGPDERRRIDRGGDACGRQAERNTTSRR